MRVSSQCLLLAFVLLFPLSLMAQEESSALKYPLVDFDGDGSSDTTVTSNQRDNSANELVFESILSTTQETQYVEFGSADDYLGLGDGDGDGITDYTVVREDEESLIWRTREQDGEISTITYGTNGEQFLSGCDFDGDGIVDRAVVNSQGIIYFSGSTDGDQSFPLPLEEGERPSDASCGDFTGDSNWEMLFIFSGESSHRAVLLSLAGEVLFEQEVKQPVNLMVHDLNQDQLLDFSLTIKPRRRAFLRHYSQVSGQSVSFNESKGRLGKKVFKCISLYNAQADDWSLRCIGRKNRIFDYDEEARRPRRNRDITLEGEDLLGATNFEASGGAADPSGRCTSVEDMADGGGGRLWKRAENGGVVALFHEQCDGERAQSVSITFNGELLRKLEPTGYANPTYCQTGASVLRSHWRDRGTDPGSFPSGIILEVRYQSGSVDCFQINGNTGRRVD